MGSKANPSDSSPTVSANELLKKGIFTKEEFIEMVEKVNLKMARMV